MATPMAGRPAPRAASRYGFGPTGLTLRGLTRAKDLHHFLGHEHLSASGFARTKKTWWTREHRHSLDFVYLYREGSHMGAPYRASVSLRIHFGIRVLNDSFPGLKLNGPSSDIETSRHGRYHLRFNAVSGSTYDRCVTDLKRICDEIGFPWFSRFDSPVRLINDKESPLEQESKVCLQRAIDGLEVEQHVIASRKQFGIKRVRRAEA